MLKADDETRMALLWLDLDRALFAVAADESTLAEISGAPWEHPDANVAAAWNAITAPENRAALEAQLEVELSVTARRVREQAAAQCRQRAEAE